MPLRTVWRGGSPGAAANCTRGGCADRDEESAEAGGAEKFAHSGLASPSEARQGAADAPRAALRRAARGAAVTAAAAAAAMASPSALPPSSAAEPPELLVRVAALDFYLAPPLPELDAGWSALAGAAPARVPVVRVFGRTPGGASACVHLHGAFPYLYFPYPEDLPQDAAGAGAAAARLALALDAALGLVAAERGGGAAGPRVFGAALVAAAPLYGAAAGERAFVKLLLLDPRDAPRAAALLAAGAVGGRALQPHEAHVPFLLQLKMDLNLAGMGWLRLRGAAPRAAARGAPRRAPPGGAGGAPPDAWVAWAAGAGGAAAGARLPPRQSACDSEADGRVEGVANREGLARAPVEVAPAGWRAVESLAPWWDEERRRAGGALPPPPPDAPRSPAPLGSAVGALREAFRVAAAERARRDVAAAGAAATPAAAAAAAAATPRSPLAEAAPRANRVALASQLFPSAGAPPPASAPFAPAVSPREDLSALVDARAVLTQAAAERARAESGGSGSERGGGSGSEDEDDLLLALAEQLDPPAAAPAAAPAAPSPDAAAPGGSQAAAQARAAAAAARERRWAATQRERDDILACTAEATPGDEEIEEAPPSDSDGGGGAGAAPRGGDPIDMDSEGEAGAPPATLPLLLGLPAGASQARRAPLALERSPPGSAARKRARRSLAPPGEEAAGAAEEEDEERLPQTDGAGDSPPPAAAEAYVSRRQARADAPLLAAAGALLHSPAASDADAAGPASSGEPLPTQPLSASAAATQPLGSAAAAASPPRGGAWAREGASQVPFDDLDADLEALEGGGGPGSDVDSGGGEEAAASGAPRAYRPRARPPTPTRLTAGCWEAGVPPVVHQVPFYSDPADAPRRPPVFGGREARVPTSAAAELPLFSAGGAALSAAALPTPPRLLAFVPARPPPSRRAAEAWLAAQAAQAARPGSGGGGGPAFGMDATTGRLLPAPLSGEGGAGEMLGTLGTPAQPSAPLGPAPGTAHSAAARASAAAARPPTAPPPAAAGFMQRMPAKPPSARRGAGAPLGSGISPPSDSAAAAGGPTPSSQAGFGRGEGGGEGLLLLALEVLADSRGALLSDPLHDAVRVVALLPAPDGGGDADDDAAALPPARLLLWDGGAPEAPATGAHCGADALPGARVERFPSEAALFAGVAAAVQALDPDVLLGWDLERGSLGYLADRAAALGAPCPLRALSRLPDAPGAGRERFPFGAVAAAAAAAAGGGAEAAAARRFAAAAGPIVPGRIVLDVWRLMRAEVKLGSYSLEAVAAAVLRRRAPAVPQRQLAAWLAAGPGGGRWRALAHLARRGRLCLALLARLDLVGRTAELARLFGIDFASVLARGSQYRVEAMALRLARARNLLALSATREQVARQPAMEAVPLIMEPRSRFYENPVCVLDFQSLYPSMVIAYNLCFSTALGRPAHVAGGAPARLGALEAWTAPPLPCRVDELVVAPNGAAFAPASARPGLLPRLLSEILETRVMVKAAARRAPPSARALARRLGARQFGLKLIANVTYGYAAAGFSGRMPMAELADAIVASGRETLEAAIRLVQGTPRWRARVVYGDTDSMFVELPGRSVEEAFVVGAEIAAAVTAANPAPVELKLEKVYRACVLLAKKRYAGAAHAAPGAPATFDAKGIETVRRDACPAAAKILERALRTLFAGADLSAVRRCLERQLGRVLAGRASPADFVFAKEVRGAGGYRPGAAPPAALVAARAVAADPRAEPRAGERVAYVVVEGPPGARLADLVVPPRALVESGGALRLAATYYITKQILPAVERALSLAGGDARAWFAEMPRPRRAPAPRRAGALGGGGGGGGGGAGATLERFYLSRHCAACDALTRAHALLCAACAAAPQLAAATLASRAGRLGARHAALARLCGECGGGGGGLAAEGGVVCDSIDCGVFFERRRTAHELRAATELEAGAGGAAAP